MSHGGATRAYGSARDAGAWHAMSSRLVRPAPTAPATAARGGTPRAGPLRASARWRLDALLAGLLGAATFVVHDLHYMLTAPFWVDESWVAVSTRVALHDVPHVTAVTPLGWTFLLRSQVVGGEQGLRLLPLAFAALSVGAAYVLVRCLPWSRPRDSRSAAVLAGLGVLLAPSSLLRNDLKQYTADAFCALVLLLMVARVERASSRTGLVALSAACTLGFLISATDLFVSAAAFGALFLLAVGRRDLRRTLEVAAAGMVTGLLLAVLFLILYLPHVQPSLKSYWRFYYPPVGRGVAPTLAYLHLRGDQMASYLGSGSLVLGLLLVVAGALTLVRLRRPALALTALVLLLEMFVLGAAKKYPLFDQRTSHFLTVILVVFAATGVAGLCVLLARVHVALGALAAAVVVAAFFATVIPDLRARSIPVEDVRTPTAYVAAHRAPLDVILLSSPTSWGFGYYWPVGRPGWRASATNGTGFQTTFPGQPRIVVATDRTRPAIASAVRRALRLAADRPGARVWLVRMHVIGPESAWWRIVLRDQRLQVKRVLPCSLVLLTPTLPGAPLRHTDVAPPLHC